MRWFHTCLALSLALVVQAAGTITANPGVPFPGRPVTFILTANPDPVGQVQWSFGDGTTVVGGAIATTTYVTPGSYTVRAVFRSFNGGALSPPQVAQAQVRVADHPAAPFSIAMLRLRWEDGGIEASVPQGSTPLVAYLDLKCEGAGAFLAQWTVDGVPVGTVTRQVAFASAITLDSRDLPSLPTTELGEHQVSLRILSPQVSFQVPVIRYFVRLDRGEPPQIDTVAPPQLRAGEEAELQLTGRNLTADMRLSFGKDIAVLASPRILSPGRATVRVYLSPTARPGLRRIGVSNPHGKARGPGSLRVVEQR
ncbi:MAG: PKD domain-containing protein [Geothrix sp.]|uniref:PKD domain-containing protein n=1 Tax=Geothrix sp. TaxID=1962974 RepID=UPI0017F9F541|nr:PKD domain-containing protein [Geothrix sp.]NWJ41356.1 PKD domain-containing protein [Geothrix sp.]WIL20657.1 MAG: PKD domain-containing protein [Geothrix sp.]